MLVALRSLLWGSALRRRLFSCLLFIFLFGVYRRLTVLPGIIRIRKGGQGRVITSTVSLFIGLYREQRERGSQLAVVEGGELIFDASGGRTENELLDFDKLAVVFSSSKTVESLVVAMLCDRKLLSYDEPVKKHLPELDFLSAKCTIRDLMQYRAGFGLINKKVTLAQAEAIFHDVDKTLEFLKNNCSHEYDANVKDSWYHAYTRGFVVSCIVQRVYGKSIHEFIQHEIIAPINAVHKQQNLNPVEFYLEKNLNVQNRIGEFEAGIGPLWVLLQVILHQTGIMKYFFEPSPSDRTAHRYFLRDNLSSGEAKLIATMIFQPWSRIRRSVLLLSDQPLGTAVTANSPRQRALPLASAMGVTNARSLAIILGELAKGGGMFLSPEGFQAAMKVDLHEVNDLALDRRIRYTQAGWGYGSELPGWVGWEGAGGSVAYFNPALNASMVYIPTRLMDRSFNSNGTRLLAAVDEDMIREHERRRVVAAAGKP